MTDFLKANPYVSREEYLWEWTIPQVMLSSYDYTHVRYLSEKEYERKKRDAKARRYDNPLDLVNDLGIPIFNRR